MCLCVLFLTRSQTWPLVRCLSLLSQLASLNSPGNYGNYARLWRLSLLILPPLPICSMATPTSPSGPPLFSLFQSTPPGCQKHAASLPRQCLIDTHAHTYRQKQIHTWILWTNMGQILSWIRGPREGPALQDVAVEEQVCVSVCVCHE